MFNAPKVNVNGGCKGEEINVDSSLQKKSENLSNTHSEEEIRCVFDDIGDNYEIIMR